MSELLSAENRYARTLELLAEANARAEASRPTGSAAGSASSPPAASPAGRPSWGVWQGRSMRPTRSRTRSGWPRSSRASCPCSRCSQGSAFHRSPARSSLPAQLRDMAMPVATPRRGGPRAVLVGGGAHWRGSGSRSWWGEPVAKTLAAVKTPGAIPDADGVSPVLAASAKSRLVPQPARHDAEMKSERNRSRSPPLADMAVDPQAEA